MFAGSEVVIDAGFDVACQRVAALVRGGWLRWASDDAYEALGRGLRRVGPVRGVSRLIEVTVRDLVVRGDVAVLALRWEATGPGHGLFPVLDADVTLTPRGEAATALAMTGSYRPPLGAVGEALDRAVLHNVAEATLRNFVQDMADAAMSVELGPVEAPRGGPPGPGRHLRKLSRTLTDPDPGRQVSAYLFRWLWRRYPGSLSAITIWPLGVPDAQLSPLGRVSARPGTLQWAQLRD